MQEWRKKIKDKKITIGILGLGYTGLPLAKQFVAANLKVIGFDTNEEKIKTLRKSKSPISSITHKDIKEMKKNDLFDGTTDMSRLEEVDVILVCVPTPMTHNREPDMKHIYDSSRTIAKYLKRGQLVIIKSTCYPGTTRDKIKPKLDENSKGLKAGKDYHLAFAPEREDPGNEKYGIHNITKVVGGFTDKCRDKACAIFNIIVNTTEKHEVDVFPVVKLEIAEAAKILENVYRFVNIALVNELKMVFDKMNIDIWQVIEAAKTKPFGFEAFYPGPGVGGHCIAIDPHYMTWIAAKHKMKIEIIEVASKINDEMPRYVVKKITKELEKLKKKLGDSKILVLGVAYKKDTSDLRESPSIEILKLLHQKGAEVDYYDHYFPKISIKGKVYDTEMTCIKMSDDHEEVANYDVVLIATDHSKYKYDKIAKNAKLIVDTRNATCLYKADKIVKA